MKARLLSRWNTFILVVLGAAIATLFVNNVITINRLMQDIKALEYERDAMLSSNKILVHQLATLQSAERIVPLAKTSLGLVQPTVTPIIIRQN